jgi:NCS1 family nucleobase:cation symporter-1
MTQFAELRSIDVVPDDERHGRAFSRCTPWSAINLTDYYLIPKERYGIPPCPARGAATAPGAGTRSWSARWACSRNSRSW